jgi:hypothetical protein
MAMGGFPSLILTNIYMERFENLALDSASQKPSLWFRYVGDKF